MNELFQRPIPTIGEFISAVCRITNGTDAKQFATDYVEWLSNRDDLTQQPEAIMRANIGFCFGEGMSNEEITMWVNACSASHPWFGTTLPTPEQALAIGKAFAQK